MNITPIQLLSEFQRANAEWPFIQQYEYDYGLPWFTLFAVGSRETNLTNEVGDSGHGNGVWQLDNRFHTIPAGFNQNVAMQCRYAAAMLQNLGNQFHGNWRAAFAAYNAGAGTVQYNLSHGLSVDQGTAGNNYGLDVLQRQQWLESNVAVTVSLNATEAAQLQQLHDVWLTPHKMPNGYEVNLAGMIQNLYVSMFYGGTDAAGSFPPIADMVKAIMSHVGA